MAQIAVLPRRQEPAAAAAAGAGAANAATLYTPGKPPLSPHPADSSLITSTVRKRKVPAVDAPPAQQPHASSALPDEGKRQRMPPVDRGLLAGSSGGGEDGVVQLSLASPHRPSKLVAAAAEEAWLQQAHEQQQQQQQHGGGRAEEGGVLFSPHFHLHREGSHEPAGSEAAAAADAAAAAGAPPAAEATSTDHSTSTGASLSLDLEGGVAPGGEDASDCEAADYGTEAALARMAAAARHAHHDAHVPDAGGAAADVDDDECLDFDPLLFIKRLPPLEACVPPRREFLLPKKTRRSKQKTLVLDLDETLVHSTLDGYCRPDFTFPVEVGQMRHMVSVRQRPHLHTFLERVSQLFEVVVFTASQRVYAEQLLDVVDPGRRLVRHRVYRESCVLWEGNYLKDLTVLGRDLAHTLIVDNSPQAFGFQLDNGIPIESWYDDDGDEELLKLIPFLERVAGAEDVRPHIQKRYRLRSLVEAAADPDQQYLQYHQAAAGAMGGALVEPESDAEGTPPRPEQ